jgi:radical SAM protein with 4Fe4S-binding SPASM domain
MSKTVLCRAPLTAALIDTNKGVRPCCVYDNTYMGNIKQDSLVKIINSDEWKKLKQQMYNNEWPEPCLPCKEREEVSGGWSVRHLFNDGSFDVTGWEEEKLTYLEFNGSNICNLSCLHCNAGFSSRWVTETSKAIEVHKTYSKIKRDKMSWFDAVIKYKDDENGRSTKMHLPDPELVLANLKELDLSSLRTINFKGGEPFLNSETTAILDYLDKQGILSQVSITVSTNGTYINEETLELLRKCNFINLYISIDGVGELFNYIRYGDAKFDSVEPTIAKLNTIPNIDIQVSTTVMNYNIFNLVDIRNWVIEMSNKYSKVNPRCGFANCLTHPTYLSLLTLSDDTRKELVEYYTLHTSKNNDFKQVISTLSNAYSGNRIHNFWVDYTIMMQTVRKNNIVNVVPQLEKELVYIDRDYE